MEIRNTTAIIVLSNTIEDIYNTNVHFIIIQFLLKTFHKNIVSLIKLELPETLHEILASTPETFKKLINCINKTKRRHII